MTSATLAPESPTPASSSSLSSGQVECVIVLDFGAQYTQLIARRVRECNVFCEILPHDTPLCRLKEKSPRGIIFSGGPSSVYEEGAPRVDPGIYDLGIPILGICYGHQLIAYQLGGEVKPAEQREYGAAELKILNAETILAGVGAPGSQVRCWMSHGDLVMAPPPGFQVEAVTSSAPVATMSNPERRLYGVQFHPEVAHTPFGKTLLRTFLMGPCGCRGDWTPDHIVSRAVADIRARVGGAGVVCGVSGGIDSCCVAALMHKAIGDQLTCIFVDHGLLRKGEAEQVRNDFAAAFGIRLIYADARERFLERLRGVTDPERKRKIIGEEFVRVFEEHAEQLEGVEFLAQGTLYPDVIESGGSSKAATIKTHHNVGGLPEDMTLKVIEPLRELFKDEARAVAAELGLPEQIVWRHPFPGPGLAIRILGEVTPERLAMLQEADAIFIEELRRANLYREQSQALTVLAPIHSVGVMGDQRTYGHPIILRAVTTEDFMTASWARLPYDFLEHVSGRIVNEVAGINRVVYDISSKPPATIEWE
jgi:GMP synthase (glutamine-hydrolysing)